MKFWFSFLILFLVSCHTAFAVELVTDRQLNTKFIDSDNDGLSDFEETEIYHTNPEDSDTDKDGYLDGHEIGYGFDPNKSFSDKLEKVIRVTLSDQKLKYFLGPYQVGGILVSTGRRGHPTPTGEFEILAKYPVHLYKGVGYYYPNTKWNMMFKYNRAGSFYIHGAYWHHNFGHPMSGGCVNVSYLDMEPLYNWTDIGTKVYISKE